MSLELFILTYYFLFLSTLGNIEKVIYFCSVHSILIILRNYGIVLDFLFRQVLFSTFEVKCELIVKT